MGSNFQINGDWGNDTITGTGGNDIIIGGGDQDSLNGGNGNDTLQGTNGNAGEQDYLVGGTGSDRFILADTTKTFYDDGNSTLPGDYDYATLADFNTTDDIIQLRGSSGDYLLSVSGSNTKLYINKPGSEPDELIAVINNQTALSLTASYFSYLPSITLAVSPASVTEDGTANLIYTFTRTGATTNALTVNYSIAGTADATDYTGATPGTGKTITFAAGSATATLTIDPTADTTIEANETVALTLATGTGYTGTTGNDIIIGGGDQDSLNGGNGNDTLQGTNGSAGEQDYLVGGTGSDLFILADTTKTFYDDGNSALPGDNDYATIADFNTTDDTIQLRGSSGDYLLSVDGSNTKLYINKPGSEPDELIAVINNQTALSLTASYFSYVSSPTLPSITLAVSPSSVTEDGTTNLVYTFTRTGSTTSALTVNYSIAGTAIANDYTGATPGTGKTITFAAGSSTATLSIDPTADTTVEPNETVTLTLATGTGYIVQTTTAVKGTITNDDTVRPKITLAINYSGISENSPNNFIYTFTRTGATTNPLTVNYNIAGTADANDYTGATPGTGKTITFTAGSSTATLTLDATADSTVEPNETISLQLVAGTGYNIGTTAAQIATIINDDGTRRHVGTNGKDVLLGTTANDYLIGGAGDDNLTGGA
ncbi:MAG: beta strand repeat-containing protein, partial [Dolichospermum sp.]